MNKVQLNLNSYEQTAQILINGREPSVYSDLANYTYKHFSEEPDVILDAIARELNDDFTLSVCGNIYERTLYSAAVSRNSFCSSCEAVLPAVQISSQKRIRHLSDLVAEKVFYVGISGRDGITVNMPAIPLKYGPLSVCFEKEKIHTPDMEFQISSDTVSVWNRGSTVNLPRTIFSAELLVSACETYLINPVIGQTVACVSNPAKDIAICSRLTPILSADFPSEIECGAETKVAVKYYPSGDVNADIVVTSSNPDVLSVKGCVVTANNPGNAVLEVFIFGENKPFYSQCVTVIKTIYASSLQIVELENPVLEGSVVPLKVKAVPADAVDANDIKWTTLDSAVAVVKDGTLIARSSGECIIRAQTTRAKVDAKVTVTAKLQGIKLSEPEINTSVGRKVPINVRFIPETVLNPKYDWVTSDDSVAIVVKEDGQEYIKAVGIGECTITCISEDGSTKTECYVNVESMMYKKKKKSSIMPFFLVAIALAAVLVIKLTKSSSDDLGAAHISRAESTAALAETTLLPFKNEAGYLTDPSYIPQDLIEQLAAYAIEEQTKENNADTSGFTYSDVTFCCATFSLPDENGYYYNYENSLDIFITYEGSLVGYGSNVHYAYFTPMRYKNISVNDDGTLNINVEDGIFASYFTNDLESAIDHLRDDGRYIVTRIEKNGHG